MPGEFESLDLYRKARDFRKRVWKLVEILPDSEKHVLVPQMRRAALSVTNNIAEGHGAWGYRHNISYLLRSRGSMNELLDDLNAGEDQGCFRPDHLENLRTDARDVIRLINGLIRHLRKCVDKENVESDRACATLHSRRRADQRINGRKDSRPNGSTDPRIH